MEILLNLISAIDDAEAGRFAALLEENLGFVGEQLECTQYSGGQALAMAIFARFRDEHFGRPSKGRPYGRRNLTCCRNENLYRRPIGRKKRA